MDYDDFDGREVPSQPRLGGYGAAMAALREECAAHGCAIRMRTAVEAVRWKAAGARLEGGSEGGGEGGSDEGGRLEGGSDGRSDGGLDGGSDGGSDEGVEIECKGGGLIRADACVLAVPLSPLRQLRFEPPLPAAQREAMQHWEQGRVEKVFVRLSAHASAREDGSGGGVNHGGGVYHADPNLGANLDAEGARGEGVPLPSLKLLIAAEDGTSLPDSKTKNSPEESPHARWPRALRSAVAGPLG